MQVFKFQAGSWTGTFTAYDVDRLAPPMKARLLETVDGFAARAGACEAPLQQDGLQRQQYRPLLEAAHAVDLHALQWVPLAEHMALFDQANFDHTWGTSARAIYSICVDPRLCPRQQRLQVITNHVLFCAVEQQARLYARLVCVLLDVEAGAVREQLANAMREHLRPHLQPNEAMPAAAEDLRSHLRA